MVYFQNDLVKICRLWQLFTKTTLETLVQSFGQPTKINEDIYSNQGCLCKYLAHNDFIHIS